jgi:ricin-type beta-trefoil lectin protein/CHAP domain-containing protein
VHFTRHLTMSILVTAGMAASALAASPVAGSASTAAASGGASAKPLQLSAALRTQLLSQYATFRHLPVTDISAVAPGMAHGAVVSPGGQEWAVITFSPAVSAPQSVDVTFQDGASSGVFTRPAGGAWTVAGLGGEPVGCGTRLPAEVRALWQLSPCTTPASAPAAAPAVPAGLSAGAKNALTLTADIARSQVGVSDNPRVTSFSGLDCDPYTAIEAPWVSTSGCGKDGTFGIRDATEFWCADFAKWVWRQAGVTSDLNVLTPAAASFYTWGKKHNESMPRDPANPRVGDAVVFYPNTKPNGNYADHVGIVTAVNSNGTVNLANGDFLGSSNISVQANNNVRLKPWAASIWGSGEDWTFVSPKLSTVAHSGAELIGAQSKKCADTQDAKFASGTKEEIWSCHNGTGQTWAYNSKGELTVDGGKYCLEVFKRKTGNGAIADLWSCNGGPNQQWTFGPGGSIVGAQSGKCLNVKGGRTTNGTQLVIYACIGTSNEKWSWS